MSAGEPARKKKRAASHPSKHEDRARRANLNVRVTYPVHTRWQRAADQAGMTLSAFVEYWMDLAAGIDRRLLVEIEQLARTTRTNGPRVSIAELAATARARGWRRRDVQEALVALYDLGLVDLEQFEDGDAARPPQGPPTHVSLRARPRAPMPAWRSG